MLQTTLSNWFRKSTVTARTISSSPSDQDSNFESGPNSILAPLTTQPVNQALPYSTLVPLSNDIVIDKCSEQHIQSFRRLNALLLPIPYPESFYKETLNDPVIASVTRLAFWKEKSAVDGQTSSRLVAAIRCRISTAALPSGSNSGSSLYISTITTLSPYREHGLATHLLDIVARAAVKEFGITSITAHVWEANEEALKWYQRRGFKVICKEDDYYRRLAPKTAAWVVQKTILPSELIQYEKGLSGVNEAREQ